MIIHVIFYLIFDRNDDNRLLIKMAVQENTKEIFIFRIDGDFCVNQPITGGFPSQRRVMRKRCHTMIPSRCCDVVYMQVLSISAELGDDYRMLSHRL